MVSVLCVTRACFVCTDRELGMCRGLGGSDAWNAYAEPERTEKAARAFRFMCRARRHARSHVNV